jgi:hypothetical protein
VLNVRIAASMESQMEAKLASMGLKSPASPAVRQLARQSLGTESFLSPNAALFSDDSNAAVTLAQQRAKLKAQAHRISAPGTLTSSHTGGDNGPKSPSLWTGNHDGDRRSPSPSFGNTRPKSTGSDRDVSASMAGNVANNLSPFFRGEEQMSPMPGGSWASMVNTPVVPMFGQNNNGGQQGGEPTSPNLDSATGKFANWGLGPQPANSGSSIVLDDARKFRRNARLSNTSPSGQGNQQTNGSSGASVQGILSGMYDESSQNAGGQNRRPSSGQHQNQNQNNNRVPSGTAAGAWPGGVSSPNPGLLSPQAAAMAAQQNWRALNQGSPNPVSSPDAAALANLLGAQHQMQLQLQQNLGMMGLGGMGGMGMSLPNMAGQLSPVRSVLFDFWVRPFVLTPSVLMDCFFSDGDGWNSQSAAEHADPATAFPRWSNGRRHVPASGWVRRRVWPRDRWHHVFWRGRRRQRWRRRWSRGSSKPSA